MVATFIGATPDPRGSYFAAALGASRGKAPQDRLLAGRLPDPGAASEVVINEPAVQAWHTGIGRTLSIHTYADDQIAAWFGQSNEAPRGPVIDATVVGVSRGIEDVSDIPEPIFFAGPAFVERWGSQIADATTVALVNAAPGRDGAVVEALNTRLDPRYRAGRTVEQDDFASRVAETIDVEVTVLVLFAIAAALAGLVVVGHRGRRHPAGGGDGLDRLALRHHGQQGLVLRRQVAAGLDGPDERADDRRVQHRAAGRHLPDGLGQLVALGDAVLQQVGVAGRALGQQRDGVVGVVVLGEDHDAGARVALADLLAGVDALTLEVRGHPDVGHDHLRLVGLRTGDERVVVLRRGDDVEVGLGGQHGPHAFADDHAVVSDQDADA